MISKEQIIQLYIKNNLKRNEVSNVLNISERKLKRLISQYQITKPQKLRQLNREKTNLKKYGVKTPSESSNIRKTYIKNSYNKWGYSNPAKSEIIKNKIIKTYSERHGGMGNASASSNQKYKKTMLLKYKQKHNWNIGILRHNKMDEKSLKLKLQKEYFTKKKNGTFNISKSELEVKELLLQKYPDLECQYKSELYPYNCDFYIPSLDLYIEFQGLWTHGREPYDFSNKKHQEIIQKWKEKSKTSKFYESAINVWSISDPLKRKIVKDNKLNYLEFFNIDQFMEWYNEEQ